MFSSLSQLKKRTPEDGTDRENFLSLLVDEYLNSSSLENKQQVLANLANFAYDPVNYGFIRDVGVLDVFLHVIKTENSLGLLHFASAGICNLCLDPLNAEYILKNTEIKTLTGLLKTSHPETIINTITILINLCTEQTKPQLNTEEIIQIIQTFKESSDKRISNIASIFLEDVCNL